MNPIANHSVPTDEQVKHLRSPFSDWLSAFRGSVRPSRDIIRVVDQWLDDADVTDARWIKRTHPEYEVKFSASVRGQKLHVYIDYNASSDFLGLFAYPYEFTPDVNCKLYESINRINLAGMFGVLELDPESELLRYRFTVDVEGLRITPKFLTFMLEGAHKLIGDGLTKLLPKPMLVGGRSEPPF